MKKVINIILLVVLGVSLSGCEWLYGLYFGIDGGIDNPRSVDVTMTEIAQYGCEGEIVDIISFCKANGEIDSTIQTIQIEDSLVSIEPMIKNGKYFEMNITIDNSTGTIKYNVPEKKQNSNASSAEGIKISCNRKAVISNVGVKEVENNYNDTIISDFRLWDVFKFNEDIYVVLSASENTNIQCGEHTGGILKNDSVEKIINDTNRVNGKDYHKISVMGAMNGVSKMGYVIDNRVYLKTSRGWNYYCNYSYSNLYITSKCVTMIVMRVDINEDSKENDSYFSTTNKENKYYFNQTENKDINSRYFVASWN